MGALLSTAPGISRLNNNSQVCSIFRFPWNAATQNELLFDPIAYKSEQHYNKV